MSTITSFTNIVQLHGSVADLAKEVDKTITAFKGKDVVSVAVTPIVHSEIAGATATAGVLVTVVWRES